MIKRVIVDKRESNARGRDIWESWQETWPWAKWGEAGVRVRVWLAVEGEEEQDTRSSSQEGKR